MATSVQFRPQNRDLGMIMRQVDEDLAVFLGLRNAQKEINDHSALGDSHGNVGLEPKSGSLFSLNASQEEIFPTLAVDEFLNLEIGRSDHNWLVVQPDPMTTTDKQNLPATKAEISNSEVMSEKSKASRNDESNTSGEGTLNQEAQDSSSSTHTDNSSSASSTKRPSSSGSRKQTSTTRSTLPAKSKPSRPSTPASRSTLPSPPSRPTTARSRPHPPIVSKPGPRSAKPTCKPTAPTTVMSKAPNKRPVSAPRGRKMNGLNSSSPPKAQARNKVSSSSSGGGEDVNPVEMGARMVNRVVSMRKLAPPPKENECVSSRDNLIGKSSQESSGFGRSLSKKSLDMAIRHMDIRRSISDKVLGK